MMLRIMRLLFVLCFGLAYACACAQTDDDGHAADTVVYKVTKDDFKPEESDDYADEGKHYYENEEDYVDADDDYEDDKAYLPIYSDGIRVDSAFSTEKRKVNEARLNEWKNSDDFIYGDEEPEKKKEKVGETTSSSPVVSSGENALERFFNWLGKSNAGKIIFWLLVAAIGVLLVVTLVGPGFGVFKRRPKEVDEPTDADNKELSPLKSDLERALDEALNANNYRQAVRLMYLVMLKRLIDRNMVAYREGKTNFEYVMELQGTRFYDDFMKMTRVFEYTWYGKFELTEPMFAQVREGYEKFISIRY